MNCPKCDAQIAPANAVECPACGVMLSKASSRPMPRLVRAQAAAPAAPASRSTSWPAAIKIAIVIAAVWIVWNIATGKKSSALASSWYQGAEGFERARAEQKTTEQPILLYFYTDWCGYCKKLDREVLSTTKFATTYPSVIKVKVNPERDGSAASALAARYGIRGFPAMFVVPAKGETASLIGYGGADEYYAGLSQSITR